MSQPTSAFPQAVLQGVRGDAQEHVQEVRDIGQIEVDEIYVAVDTGRQFVLAVQAKGGSDQLSVVQSEQDLLWCRERLTDLICRPILTLFAQDHLIAMFEVALDQDGIKVVQERHYRLVAASEVTSEDLLRYRNSA